MASTTPPTQAEQRSLEDLRAAMRERFGPDIVAHDLAHLERVEAQASALAAVEGGRLYVVRAASLLHDVHRLLEASAGAHVRPEDCDAEVRALLAACDAPEDAADAVSACVLRTEMYRCAGDDLQALAWTVEQRVVRDADMLDALGAVGIARAFMFGARLGQPIWADQDIAASFVPGRTASIVHHFHEKLLRLHEEMLTAEGRRIALRRTVYMQEFLRQLTTDLAGDSTRTQGPSA